jgi:hypothetical protein
MRRTLAAALFAGLAGMAFAATPASALPSTTDVRAGDTNAGFIYVGRRDRVYRNRYYDRRYSYYRPYNRYYRPYAYNRPYAYGGYPYGYPYGYYGRPGISFGFSF